MQKELVFFPPQHVYFGYLNCFHWCLQAKLRCLSVVMRRHKFEPVHPYSTAFLFVTVPPGGSRPQESTTQALPTHPLAKTNTHRQQWNIPFLSATLFTFPALSTKQCQSTPHRWQPGNKQTQRCVIDMIRNILLFPHCLCPQILSDGEGCTLCMW